MSSESSSKFMSRFGFWFFGVVVGNIPAIFPTALEMVEETLESDDSAAEIVDCKLEYLTFVILFTSSSEPKLVQASHQEVSGGGWKPSSENSWGTSTSLRSSSSTTGFWLISCLLFNFERTISPVPTANKIDPQTIPTIRVNGNLFVPSSEILLFFGLSNPEPL